MKQTNLMREDAAEIGEDFMKALPEDAQWGQSPVECYVAVQNRAHDLEANLRELLRLYDHRADLGKREKAGEISPEELRKALLVYGREKLNAWIGARALVGNRTE